MWNPALEFAEGLALPGRGLAPVLLLLDAARPRHAGVAGPDAGAGARRRLRGHRLSHGAGPGAERTAILWNREMLAGVYQAQWVPAKLRDGRIVTAVTFVVDTSHCQYCGDLPIERGASHRLRRGPPRRLPRLSRQHGCPCPRARHPRSLYRGAWSNASPACAARTSSRRRTACQRKAAEPIGRAPRGEDPNAATGCSRYDIVACDFFSVGRWLRCRPICAAFSGSACRACCSPC